MYASEILKNNDKNSIWHPYTKMSAAHDLNFPIIERGKDEYLYDVDGNKYLDAISSWWCCNLGHSRKELIDAIKKQADKLQHSILGNLTHPSVIELSSKLVNLFTDSNRRVSYASDGASAIEAALKISVQYWYNMGKRERTKFVSLSGDYHGDTLGAVSVGFVEDFHKMFTPIVKPSFKADAPCCKTCAYDKTEETCLLECFVSMQSVFEQHAYEIAAVIVEPLCQGASGMRMYTPRYLKKLSELCLQNDVLLIIDEIAMGFGRTGKMFAFEHAGIDPDIVCIGKGLSGGYLPISASIVKEKIFNTFSDTKEDKTFYHGHTFAGNPIACAVSLAVLEIYKNEKVVDKAYKLGVALKREMEKFEELDCVDNVRCLGMIGAVQLKDSKEHPLAVKQYLLEKGILVRPLGSVVYLMLPLIVSEELLLETVGELFEAVKNTGK